jgi:hypothetical protein
MVPPSGEVFTKLKISSNWGLDIRWAMGRIFNFELTGG